MAWLRLLRSFRPVEAVRLDLVPRATRAATAAAELTGTRSPFPPERNTPLEGCSRTSIFVAGGGGAGGVSAAVAYEAPPPPPLPVSDENRTLLFGVLRRLSAAVAVDADAAVLDALLWAPVAPGAPLTPSKRLWNTLL